MTISLLITLRNQYKSESTQLNSDDTSCLPGQPTTFFFGYSNDLDRQVIVNMKNVISNFFGTYPGLKRYVTFANVRLDLKQPEPISYHDSLSDFYESIVEKYPDPKLGYGDNSTQSDVMDVLMNFLSHRPICGATVLLALKRTTNDVYNATTATSLLSQHHVYVYSLMSNQRFGEQTETFPIYKISTESNGMYIPSHESHFDVITNRIITFHLNHNPFYLHSFSLEREGSMELGTLSSRVSDILILYVGVNIGDNVSSNDTNYLYFTLDSPQDHLQFNVTLDSSLEKTWWNNTGFPLQTDYNVTMHYSCDIYCDPQVRVYTNQDVLKWPDIVFY